MTMWHFKWHHITGSMSSQSFYGQRRSRGYGASGECLEVVLKDALCNLDRKLSQYDLKLICREGDDSSTTMLRQLCEECSDIGAVYWNKEHTPESRMREEKYQAVLQEMGVESLQCQSSLLYDPTSPSLAAGFHGGHCGTLMPFKRTYSGLHFPLLYFVSTSLEREVVGMVRHHSRIL